MRKILNDSTSWGVEANKIDSNFNETEFDISFSGAGNLKVEFSKIGTTAYITFPSIGSMYAYDNSGNEFATTTKHLGQTYTLPSSNSVLVWNLDSDTIAVQAVSASRDERSIVLLRKAYHLVTGGYFSSQYWDWENSNRTYFDISFSGAANLDVDFSISGNSVFITFPSIGTMYAVGKDGQNIGETTAHLGQTYELPSTNNVLVWNIDSNTIVVQGVNEARDNTNIVLLRKAYHLVTGGYYAAKYWDWETKKEVSNYPSNVDFMSREGRVNGFPGNSYLSVYECKRVGIDNIRVSVRKTLDGYFVLSHDDAINDEARETNGDLILSTINISETNLATLNLYDYGIKYGSQYAGLAIAELDPMIDTCAKMGMRLTLELKFDPDSSEVESICKTISKYSIVKNTWISTTTQSVLTAFNNELSYLNSAFIANITSTAIDVAATFKTGNNKTRIDIFDSNTVTEALYYQAVQADVEIKVGSVYIDSDIASWYNVGVKVIEVANIPFPHLWLNEYNA